MITGTKGVNWNQDVLAGDGKQFPMLVVQACIIIRIITNYVLIQ